MFNIYVNLHLSTACTCNIIYSNTNSQLRLICGYFIYLQGCFFCVFFSIRLLSVLRDHSFFIPPTTANDLRLRRISIQDFIHYIFCPIFILQKEPVFPFSMSSAKQGNYWYHFYNVFGMTRSLTGDWTRDLLHSKPALYP